MKVVGVIPARLSSTRLPNKPLLMLKGKSLIQRVYENCKSSQLDDVIVACDSIDLFNEVLSFGGKAFLSGVNHINGTSRIAEVARGLDADYILNIQGDEPFVDAMFINELLNKIDTNYNMLTVCSSKITDVTNPNEVKVILNKFDEVIYFSRSVIPYERNKYSHYYKHIGIYLYKHDFLLKYISLESPEIEIAESLEQLRVIYHGYKIKCLKTNKDFLGIDTPEDLERAIERIDISES